MKKSNFIINKSEMMLLFNSLVELGYDRNIQIAVPLLGNTVLFKIRVKPNAVQIIDFITREDYNKFYYPLTRKMKGRTKEEVPSHDDIRQALYQAGILQPKGLGRLNEVISALKNQDVIKGGDVYYIALDTNLLRDRFFSNFLQHKGHHPNLDFILCETVREELKNRKEKFRRDRLKTMAPLQTEILAQCFLNQNGLEDRLRYIGFLEYNRMRSATSCEEIDAPSARTGMKNDQFILEAYSNYVDIGRKVIFISRDNEAVRMMTGEDNVIPILLEQAPEYRTDYHARWCNFFDLLYLLGILYGKLNLLIGGIRICSIFGVWPEKDAHEWENELTFFKIVNPRKDSKEDIRDYQFIVKSLKQNLGILSQLWQNGNLKTG